jgi:hypothetical protein
MSARLTAPWSLAWTMALAAVAVGLAAGSVKATAASAQLCTVYDRGTALSVTVTASNADSFCQSWITTKGKQGEFWSLTGSPDEVQSMACIFRYKSGGIAEVDDGGSQIFGQSQCAVFAGTSGWVEDTQAEQASRARAQGAAAAAAKSQAKASAAQAARNQLVSDARNVSYDVQSLNEDTGTLKGDLLGSDLSTLRRDLTTIRGDLHTVQIDSADVTCGDAGVTANDEAVMANDISVMGNDITVDTNDINSVRGAIATLTHDQALYTTRSARLRLVATAEPTSATRNGAINAGQSAIGEEQARFNSARLQAASLLSQAKVYVAQAQGICKSRG